MSESRPTWQTDDGRVQLYLRDCLDILPTLDLGSVEAFAAEQSYAAHSSCGVVQPVTVAECEALNAALRAATEALSMELSNARSD